MPVSSRIFDYNQSYSEEPIKVVQVVAQVFKLVDKRDLDGTEIISTGKRGEQIFLKPKMYDDKKTGKQKPFEMFLNCSKSLVKQFFKQPNIIEKFQESNIDFDLDNVNHQKALMNVLAKVKMIIGVNATDGPGRRLTRVLFSSRMLQEGEDLVFDNDHEINNTYSQ